MFDRSRHKYFSSVSAGSSGASLSKFKPVNWKTKICYKWEQTGHCSYGDKCNFAHGTAGMILLKFIAFLIQYLYVFLVSIVCIYFC